jgi:solute carrier family 25 (mitochondrial adenine nucleotide translocator), member 4/5/6/31
VFDALAMQAAFVDMCVNFVVGGGAAAISRTSVAPLARIKTLLQAWPQTQGGVAPPHPQAAPVPMHTIGVHSQGWRAVAVAMWRADGVLGFWRGNGTNVARIFPTAALNHALFPWWKRRISTALGIQSDSASSFGLFVVRTGAGSMSVICTLALLYPLEVARTRLTCDVAMTNGRRTYGGVWDCLVRTAQTEGVRAVYKGFVVSAAAVLPMLTVSHATFDSLRQVFLHGRDKASPWEAVWRTALGAVAGLAAQVVVYPLDTVRRRMQLDGSPALHAGPIEPVSASASSGAAPKPLDPRIQAIRDRVMTHVPADLVQRFKLPGWLSGWADTTVHTPRYRGSAVQCFRAILREEGPHAFYRGIIPQAIKTVPAAFVQFIAYAALLRAISSDNQ